jgi:hypothetical protein
VQRDTEPLTYEQVKKQQDIKENIGRGTAAMDLGQKTAELAMGDAAPKGLGLGMGGFIELMNRLASGQGIVEAGGGAATQVASSAVGGSKAVESVLGPSSKGAGIAGLIGSGMKFLGSLLGEKPEDIGIGDAGEYVSTAATLASPHMAFSQGVEGGLKSFYNTGTGVVDLIRTGDTKHLEGTREANLKGDNTSVIQGYAMTGEVISSLISGDTKNLDRIAENSRSGEYGALPQLGSGIGGWLRDNDIPIPGLMSGKERERLERLASDPQLLDGGWDRRSLLDSYGEQMRKKYGEEQWLKIWQGKAEIPQEILQMERGRGDEDRQKMVEQVIEQSRTGAQRQKMIEQMEKIQGKEHVANMINAGLL